ncbi:hypothetical protein BGZ76_011247 [Entomortierella beljakovae]|nr:hypothetical protein BGZ76_011247 [Entomortierella beljakovae]
MLFKSIIAAAIVCMSSVTVQAHVGLKTPCGRYQPDPSCPAPPPGQSVDFNVNSPIGTKDSKNQPLCKNDTYHPTTPTKQHLVPYTTRTKFQAGSTINTEYSVSASHRGGHCQWALSYDDGATWVVLKTMIRECLDGVQFGQDYKIPVKIPADAPPGKATFMWLWNNAEGNRELYSNCADIEITGGKVGGSIKGVVPLIANYGPDSLHIPEYLVPGNSDMAEAFDTRRSITVFAKGSGGTAPNKPTTTAKPKPTTTKPKPTTTKPKPTTTTTTSKPTTVKPKPTSTKSKTTSAAPKTTSTKTKTTSTKTKTTSTKTKTTSTVSKTTSAKPKPTKAPKEKLPYCPCERRRPRRRAGRRAGRRNRPSRGRN